MNEIAFNDFIKLNRGFDLPNDKMIEGRFPVIASTTVKGYHNEYKVKPPCVVTGRSGSLGKVQYSNNNCWPLNTTLYVKDFKGNCPEYVYYYLQIMHLENYDSGAGVPTLNQNHLHRIKVKVHDITSQMKIADILFTYDRLIENNTRRIEILEKEAQEIYKEWFVRMRFPGYEKTKKYESIPQGWKVERLSKVSDFTYGKMPDKEHIVDQGGYPIFSGYRTAGYYDQYMYDEEKLIVVARGVGGTGDVKFAPSKSYITNLSIIFLLFEEKLCKNYLYQMFNNTSLRYLDTGAAQSQITIDNLKRVKIILPSKALLEEYNRIVDPIRDELSNLLNKNLNLIKQRDLLLPRLMSGVLKVK